MVFQNYALMPHLTVFENVAFPLRVRRIPRREIESRVRGALEKVQLGHTANRKPRALSGGQQQRVALARSIVYEPSIILMDEPLGALDGNLRTQMQVEIKRLHSELGLTIIYVTHDQEEALTMSDRVVLMRQGRMEQIGRPEQLYSSPRNIFAATFVGESNLIRGRVRAPGPNAMLELLDGREVRGRSMTDLTTGEEAFAVVRPEAVELSSAAPGGVENVLPVLRSEPLLVGSIQRTILDVGGGLTLTAVELNRRVQHSKSVSFAAWPAESCLIYSTDPNLQKPTGARRSRANVRRFSE
jgi:putative spermidine/putrescine transport system ATP-binding protein